MKTLSIILSLSFTLLICIDFTSSISFERKAIKTGSRKKRIINGHEAELKQFPYTMLLRSTSSDGKEPRCTGALISEQTALSAAHCIYDKVVAKVCATEYFDGILGSVKESDPRVIVTFRKFHVHREYEPYSLQNDIAVLILEEPVETSDYIKTIALPEKGMRFDEEEVIAVGWGWYKFAKESGEGSLRYMEARVAKIDNICTAWIRGFNHNENICLEQHKNVCVYKGDSGGPLVKMGPKVNVLIGVLSHGYDEEYCKNLPAIYMSSSAYHDWIKENSVGDVNFVNSLEATLY